MKDTRSLFFGLASALAGISGIAAAIAAAAQSSQPSPSAEAPIRHRLRARFVAHPRLVIVQLACITAAIALVLLAVVG